MGSEVAPRVIQGRAFNGGVAQAVTRAGNTVRIVLTVMPGHPATSAPEGETVVIAFPQPVTLTAGEWADIIITWASGQPPDYAGPVWIPATTILRAAHIRR